MIIFRAENGIRTRGLQSANLIRSPLEYSVLYNFYYMKKFFKNIDFIFFGVFCFLYILLNFASFRIYSFKSDYYLIPIGFLITFVLWLIVCLLMIFRKVIKNVLLIALFMSGSITFSMSFYKGVLGEGYTCNLNVNVFLVIFLLIYIIVSSQIVLRTTEKLNC